MINTFCLKSIIFPDISSAELETTVYHLEAVLVILQASLVAGMNVARIMVSRKMLPETCACEISSLVLQQYFPYNKPLKF